MKNDYSFDTEEEMWKCVRNLFAGGFDVSLYQGEKRFYVSVIFTPPKFDSRARTLL